MSYTDMFNREKDLISDYLKEYPVLRYIMPSFTHNGINVTHRVHVLRQAYWVLVQILNAKNVPTNLDVKTFYEDTKTTLNKTAGSAASGKAAKFVEQTSAHSTTTAAGKDIVDPRDLATAYLDNATLGLTRDDVQLLAHFLRLAQTNFNLNGAGNMNVVMSAIAKDKSIVYNKPATGANKFAQLLDVFNDSSNGLSTEKLDLLKALADAPSIPALEEWDGTATTPVAKLREIANFNSLATFSALEPFNQPLFHTQSLDNLFYTQKVTVAATSITAGTVPSQGKNVTGTTEALYPSFLLLNSIIIDSASKVYLMCSQAQNSFTNSMGPVVGVGAEFTFRFEQNANGLFQLKKLDKNGQVVSENFTQKFAELVEGNEFCRAFGSGKVDAKENVACGSLIADCLGENTHDVNRCRANFASVNKPSKNFRGWNRLAQDERKYISYRILLGLGVPGRWNAESNLTFVNDFGPIYTDDELKAILGNQITKQEQLDYIKTLMTTVGTIEALSKKVDGVTRPSLAAITRPNFIEINPRVVGGVMGVAGLRGAMSPLMIGGAQESQVSMIQYGGRPEDANKIIDSINDKIKTLKQINPRALPESKESYIRNKLVKFGQLANEINGLENVVIAYITAAAQHSSKDIVITEMEIKALKDQENQKKSQMSQKINKFEGFGSLVMNKLAVGVATR
jgi:hypothetical protein